MSREDNFVIFALINQKKLNIMKLKSIALLIVLIVVSSCGIGGLEDRINVIENALGTNEPFTVKFATKDDNNVDIIDNATYLFKAGGDSEYIGKYTDGTMEIYIERFSDVDWYEGAWIEFTYNSATKAVSEVQSGTYFYNKFDDYVNTSFRYYDTNCTINLKVNQIDVTTGLVDVSVESSTTAASGYNKYEGKSMTGTFKFRGKLPVFEWTN